MSRVPNATEFLRRFRALVAKYGSQFGPRIASLRAKYDAKSGLAAQTDEALEDHKREYVINGFLAALNWRLGTEPEDGLPPNIVPEVSVRSLANGRSLRMDYLGLEARTNNPLMIV